MRRAWLAALLLACGSAVAAAPVPRIVEIVFEGNETTQPRTMLREMSVAPGDRADPEAIERSRQAVLDLGLFRSVAVREEKVDGGVRLVFTVDEKWYLLPTPRVDIKSDGTNSYGAQVRWSNFLGLNHLVRVFWESTDRQLHGIGREETYSASYFAPFVLDTRNGFSTGASYTTRPVESVNGPYEEQFRSFGLFLSRALEGTGPPSQGWSVTGGLQWTDQDTRGAAAPPPNGMATAPVLAAGYRDLRFYVYSEQGESYGARIDFARDGWASDYNYSRLTAGWERRFAVGETEHQTVHLFASGGVYADGPPGTRAFALGGASDLRGYEANFVEGNAYYLLQAEFARPVIWKWLRVVAIAEAGNVFARPGDVSLERVHASVGLGLRLRFPAFVNFEVEAGYAIPLDGGEGRIFASRV